MSFDSLAEKFANENEKASLSSSAIVAHNTDSDKYAENRKKAVKNGMPAAFATPAENPVNMDDMNSLIKDFHSLKGKTAQHMSDPEFAKVAKDDHPVLSKIEDVFNGFTDRLYGSVETAESLLTGIPAAIGGAATGLTTLALTKGDTEAAKAVQEGVSDYLTYKPKTESGKRFAEGAGKILSIPGQVGHELSEEVARQWNAPEWMRYILNTAGEFGGYALADVAIRGTNAHIQNIIDTAKESKLKGRDPELFKNYIEDVAGNHEPVQMPADAVDNILAQRNIKPEEFFSDPTAYYESKFMGDKVDIPITDLANNAEHFTPEHIKDMSLEDIPSVNEAEKQAAAQEGKGKGLSEQVTPKNEDMFAAGPGAKTKGAKGETPSDIEQLASTLPDQKVKSNPLKDAVSDALQTIQGIKKGVVNSFNALKDIGQKIWDAYRKPPEWTQFKDMLGEYELNKQKSGLEASKFVKKIQESIPKEIQEAITMYIDSGGETDLPEEYKTLAENVKNYFDSRADQAIEAGVIDHAVENYVHRIWNRDSKAGERITAETNAGMFQQNPKLAKQRVLKSISEGEELGLTMKDKRIGYLLTAYDTSLNEAIAARGFIKSLLNGKAKDGRPLVDVSGSGKIVPKEGSMGLDKKMRPKEIPDSYIIKPKTKPAESIDYKPIDHPSLRKWKWLGNDADYNPILMQGDLVVHPEIYNHMKNILGKSAIREFKVWGHRPGEALLNGVKQLKSTLLSLSMFHQVQEGVHAIGHEVNPFNVKEIDLNDPLQADLVKHGVIAFSHNAMSDFAEGVYSSGLVSKIPIIGRQMQAYGNYLFQGWIPNLKMEMAKQAYERNTKRYADKLNKDQIMELTAKEANAAFGELNYEMMGRNKTIQDMFRLVALAPDFLEARAKFVGQAFKPYGREQAAALVRLAAYMTVAAQATNYLVNGETDWTQPFSIKIDGKYYTLRSVPGDMMHLVTDPRSFSYHRLNPTITKPMIEALTGRNIFGQKQDIYSQMGDWLKGQAPIPLQGLVMDKADMNLLDSVLQSAGVGTRKARTPAANKLNEFLRDQIPVGEQDPEQKAHSLMRRDILEAMRSGKDLTDKQQEAIDNMTDRQRKEIDRDSQLTPLQVSFKHLQDPNLEKSIKVWAKASDDEREELRDIYETRINHFFATHDLSGEEADKLNEKIDRSENRE